MRFVVRNAKPAQALNQHPHGVVREFQHLQNPHRATVVPQIDGGGIFHLRLLLQHEPDETVARHDVVNQSNARRRLDQQRRDHAGEDHNIRQAEDGQNFRKRLAARARDNGVRAAGCAKNTDEFSVR